MSRRWTPQLHLRLGDGTSIRPFRFAAEICQALFGAAVDCRYMVRGKGLIACEAVQLLAGVLGRRIRVRACGGSPASAPLLYA